MASPYIEQEAKRLNIGAHADYNRDDYITPRTRSDREYVDLDKSPRMESTGEQVVGVLLIGATGAAVLVIIANLVRWFL